VSVFSYVVEHDLGFAPNPFHGACTLACCKPDIRKSASLGDYVLGTGGRKPGLRGHLIYWMRVNEILTFDEYWGDQRFQRKKPVMSGSTYLRYGDNIYHSDNKGRFRQVDSFHSCEDGSPSVGDIKRDTGKTDRVLVSSEFAYWGRSALELPEDLKCLVKKGPGHKRYFTELQVDKWVAWLDAHPERGFIAEPADWQFIEH
jgi:Nucleotide modification associated domain 2